MAVDPNQILAITQPKLEIRRISHLNVDEINEVNPEAGNNSSVQTTAGFLVPYVEVDNYIIPNGKLLSLSINQSGFLPELTMSFMDVTGAFSGMYFPRTNPILKLYIKSLAPAIKPIRSDFLITNITSSEMGNSYGSQTIETIYTVSAKLFVPGLYGNFVQSIPNKKSWEALKQIADSLKLGFATNETSTDDAMTWINPNDTVENFIKSICSRAYKNDKSFFDCFIDVNYILTFINYEKALSKDTKPMQTPIGADIFQYADLTGPNKNVTQDDKPREEGTTDIVLTTSLDSSRTGFHIAHYAMYSNHGEVLANQNFRKRVLWHDRANYTSTKKPFEFYIEPLSEKTINSKETVYQKPKLKTFETESASRWLGIDYNNNHTHYKFSRLLNQHNVSELEKNYLVVKLPGVVQAVHRGAKLSVLITRLVSSEQDGMRTDTKFEDRPESLSGSREKPDLYTSGPYIVKDIRYEYDAAPQSSQLRYSTELVLVRREWIEIGEDNKLASEKNN